MSSTIDHRPPGHGPDDPTGRFAAVPPPPFRGPRPPAGPVPGATGPVPGPGRPMPGRTGAGAAPFGAHQAYPWPPHHPGHLPPAGRPPAGPAAGPRPRRGWIPAVLVGAFVLLAVIGGVASAARTTTVPGSVTLHVTYSSLTSGSSCTGAGLFSWLNSNTTPVTIYGADGAVVGTTTLGSGTAYATGNGWSSSYADTCVFPFTLTDVPADEDFYRVKVGTGAGDGLTFTGADLRSGGAHIEYGRNGS